jgi:uncharacterized protein (TIGR02391 family)
MDDDERQTGLLAGIPQTVTMLEGLIGRLEERLSDFSSDATSRSRAAFDGLDLHPRIAAVSVELYRDKYYRNAVLDAVVALGNLVKEKSRRHDLDGVPLMTTVFSKNNPVLAVNELKDKTEEDEQEGVMHLFMGVALALRNPRAHALTPDSAQEALEYLAFLSFLARKVDQSRRTTSS